MADLVIYTAVTAGKDRLHEPAHRLPGVDYVCFTDTPALRSSVFAIRPLPFAEAGPRATARRLKLFPHRLFPAHAQSLWLDASKRIRTDLTPLLAELGKADIATFRHPARVCLYEEAEACAKAGRADPETLRAQAARYRAAGMPPQAGLYETSLLFRRHTPDVAALMERWWRELQAHSLRDQLSLPFVLHETGGVVHALDYRLWHDCNLMQMPHAWHEPGDDRNRLASRLHDRLWRLLQRLGLQSGYEQAMRRVKPFSRFRP